MILSPAKLNLSLSIKSRLNNGYHSISSYVVFLDLYDKIFIKKSASDKIKILGPFKGFLENNGGDTLIKKTLSICRNNQLIDNNFEIILEKNIPISGGLGGGSANSASIIRYFCNYKEKKLDKNILNFSKYLGADVPACIFSRPLLMEGIGDKIHFIQMEKDLDVGVVLINPKIQLSTKKVFENLKIKNKKKDEKNIMKIKSCEDLKTISKIGNHLETQAIKLVPEIKIILNLFKKVDTCICYGMTGSGPTCYGIFKSKKESIVFMNNIQSILLEKKFWSWSGGLLSQSKRSLILTK